MDSALGIVPLTGEEADRVLALPREECELLQSINATARIEGYDVARRRGAPPPTTMRTGVMHMRRTPAFTYAMEVVGAIEPVFKIGWAFDYQARARQFNLYSLPGLGGFKYVPVLFQFWATAMDAYRMEQAVLRIMDRFRHEGNREVLRSVSMDELDRAWRGTLLEVRRRQTNAA